jgi:hypothetical protein
MCFRAKVLPASQRYFHQKSCNTIATLFKVNIKREHLQQGLTFFKNQHPSNTNHLYKKISLK